MVTAPQTSLKVIVIVHFLLTVWASMSTFLMPTSYIYMNAAILAFGFWAIVSPDSVDSVFLFFVLNTISIVMDIIFLGINASKDFTMTGIMLSEYRFSLGMAIVNLLIKPFTTFVLFRLYQERGGRYSEFGIPGVSNFGGTHTGQQSAYENIDQSVPTNPTESAAPHGFDRPILP